MREQARLAAADDNIGCALPFIIAGGRVLPSLPSLAWVLRRTLELWSTVEHSRER